MREIRNPILSGFHPDPSICRVGDDFYIANSTFEWWPGVRIHHSRDLVHWRPVGGALTRTSQLDMKGNPCSGGIWAPCLSHDGRRFYLIYTDVKTVGGRIKDNHNYLVTAEDIAGPWSEPVYLNSSGFDPSLFHDDDGRKWLVNMLWDHRKGREAFAGTLCQEYDADAQALVGEAVNIFEGTKLGYTEGPHLYKHAGWYYLMLAEGGTGYDHAVTLARSREVLGPYEVDPANPMLTSAGDDSLALQKAGHASLTDTPGGQWYLVHLTGRPVKDRRCPLGRETAIQQVHWTDDGWLRLTDGGNRPSLTAAAPDLPAHPWPEQPGRMTFDGPELPADLNTRRIPPDESWLSLSARPGYLRLIGRESLWSQHTVALAARRWTSLDFVARTALEFEPSRYQQQAGLVCLYDIVNWFFLHVTHDEDRGRVLSIETCVNWEHDMPLPEPVAIGDAKKVYLEVAVKGDTMQFAWSTDGESYQPIGPAFDATLLSDECCKSGHFTGAFVGLACVDYWQQRAEADFEYFEYVDGSQ